MSCLRVRRLPACVAVMAVVALALPAIAAARPFRGHVPWSVLLCKFSDQTAQPQTNAFFDGLLLQTGGDGVADYYRTISRGEMDFQGSAVKGWYTMKRTLAAARSLSRGRRIQDCVDAAVAGGYTVPARHRVVAIVNGQVDSGYADRRVLLDPLAWNVAFAAHEMGHAMDLDHSFSDDTTQRWGGGPAEYDDEWDLMSAMHIFLRTTTRYGFAPVGLNSEYRERMGWLRRDQSLTFGTDGVRTKTVTLKSLYGFGTSGIRVVRVPIEVGNRFRYYAVELRTKGGVDVAIPNHVVRIYEVNRGGDRMMPTTFVFRERFGPRDPVQTLVDPLNDITINVNSINASAGTASVTITAGIAERCAQGYVWREAEAGDRVCVTPAVRTHTRVDNLAPGRVRPDGGASGPDTCKSGFVWREATGPGDHVCVTPATRTQARADNAAAPKRRAVTGALGPNACKPNYVWREADQLDWVCVRPSVRAAVRADNAAAPGRHLPRQRTCRQGYVWREAYLDDRVCVVPSRHAQALRDNAAAGSRLAVF